LSLLRKNNGEILLSSDFWLSEQGIEVRLQDLAEAVTWETVNNATRLTGSEAGAKVFEWITEIGPETCNYCDSQSGRRYRIGQFIPQIPAHPNCLHPNTLVHTTSGLVPIKKVAVGDLVLTHKGRYRPVVQLHRRQVKGPLFRVEGCGITGNHPVLTPNGWVRIDGLQNGTKACFVDVSRNSDVVFRDLDSDKFPTMTRKQYFLASIISSFRIGIMPVPSVNFNGNLVLRNGKVDIIDFHRILRNHFNFASLENIKKLLFKRRQNRVLLSRRSALNSLLSGSLPTPRSIVSRFNLMKSLLFRHLVPPANLSITLPSNLSSCFNKSFSNRSSGDSEFLGERKFGNARTIKTNNLSYGQGEPSKGSVSLSSPHPLTPSPIDIDTIQYKGYVHNLSVLEDESYIIGEHGLAVHNCRCHWDVLFEMGQ